MLTYVSSTNNKTIINRTNISYAHYGHYDTFSLNLLYAALNSNTIHHNKNIFYNKIEHS